MKKIKTIFLTAAIWSLLAVAASAQSSECPADRVCLTRDEAVEYLTLADKAKALEAEIAVLRQAVADKDKIAETLKIELARISGEKTQLEADRVRWTAVIDVLIKSARPKKNGLINF